MSTLCLWFSGHPSSHTTLTPRGAHEEPEAWPEALAPGAGTGTGSSGVRSRWAGFTTRRLSNVTHTHTAQCFGGFHTTESFLLSLPELQPSAPRQRVQPIAKKSTSQATVEAMAGATPPAAAPVRLEQDAWVRAQETRARGGATESTQTPPSESMFHLRQEEGGRQDINGERITGRQPPARPPWGSRP